MATKKTTTKTTVKAPAKKAPVKKVAAKKAPAKKAPAKTPAPKKVAQPTQLKVNRVSFLLDASPSMSHLVEAVKKQFAILIRGIQASTPSDQRAEISVFTFSGLHSVKNLCMNVPVDAINPALLMSMYNANGYSTALVTSTLKTIEELKSAPVAPGSDVTNLLYVMTDGQDNASTYEDKRNIAGVLANLGDRFSVGILAPSQNDARHCLMFGFPHGNIEVWDAQSVRGLEAATVTLSSSYSGYAQARALGATSSVNLFKANIGDLAAKDVKAQLDEFDGSIHPVRTDFVIKDFVESVTGKTYVPGSTYYELVKYEKKIQGYKEIAIRDKNSGKTYAGPAARQLLGLDSNTHSANVGDHGKWRIFVQSTSLNRKLPAGTSVLIKNF